MTKMNKTLKCSEVSLFFKSCKKKYKYATREDAQAQINNFGEKGFIPYRCNFCGYWHVGHTPVGKKMKQIKNEMEKTFEDNLFRYDCKNCGRVIEKSNKFGLCNECIAVILRDDSHE
jgi:rubrerythrin